ncbi:MAG: carboxypeptidase-like regulatory domain-containing protein [Candidatus Bathyarchaeaceae archaeon]
MVMKNVRFWLVLMAAIFVFLWLSSAGVAHASDGGVGDESFWPGEGGEPSFTVDGFVIDMNGEAIPNMKVFLNVGFWPLETTTDSRGYFMFVSSEILPNKVYEISVNGRKDELGIGCFDPHYCQLLGSVKTDDDGYGFKYIHIERAAIVNVTVAALFGNTEYATLYYGTESNYQFDHFLSFNVAVLGISTGYATSMSITYTEKFWTLPSYSEYIYRPYYAITYFDETLGKVISSGITEPLLNTDWSSDITHEYFNPHNLPTLEYVDFTVGPGGKDWTYQESGSYTWKASVVPFGIIFEAFGQMISIDITVTVTQGKTTWVRYEINNPTGETMIFRVYTPGAKPDLQRQIGGMELHIWCISGAD